MENSRSYIYIQILPRLDRSMLPIPSGPGHCGRRDRAGPEEGGWAAWPCLLSKKEEGKGSKVLPSPGRTPGDESQLLDPKRGGELVGDANVLHQRVPDPHLSLQRVEGHPRDFSWQTVARLVSRESNITLISPPTARIYIKHFPWDKKRVGLKQAKKESFKKFYEGLFKIFVRTLTFFIYGKMLNAFKTDIIFQKRLINTIQKSYKLFQNRQMGHSHHERARRFSLKGEVTSSFLGDKFVKEELKRW